MKNLVSKCCPICEEKLHLNRLVCPNCRAEYPVDEELSPFAYLNAEQMNLLITFLKCKGNIKAVEMELGISYPTVNKRYEDLLIALGLKEETKKEKEPVDMRVFGKIDRNSTKPSDIMKNKLYDYNGTAMICLQKGENCYVSIADNGEAFVSDKLPNQTISFEVFDIIVSFLEENGGKAPKGLGRSDKVGYGKCGPETIMYQLATQYYGKQIGESTFDPIFVLAAMLEWCGIAENGWGYIKLLK